MEFVDTFDTSVMEGRHLFISWFVFLLLEFLAFLGNLGHSPFTITQNLTFKSNGVH